MKYNIMTIILSLSLLGLRITNNTQGQSIDENLVITSLEVSESENVISFSTTSSNIYSLECNESLRGAWLPVVNTNDTIKLFKGTGVAGSIIDAALHGAASYFYRVKQHSQLPAGSLYYPGNLPIGLNIVGQQYTIEISSDESNHFILSCSGGSDDITKLNLFTGTLYGRFVDNAQSPSVIEEKVISPLSIESGYEDSNRYLLLLKHILAATDGPFDETPDIPAINTLKTFLKNAINQKEADTKIYLIELDRWAIDGTPAGNVAGINNALEWTKTQGFTEIVFPTQEYVLDANSFINIEGLRDVVINFNNAIFKINTNGLRKNKMMNIDDVRNIKIINGTLLGDRLTHDYVTDPKTHEGNIGILIGSMRGCEMNNVTVRNIVGWSISISKGHDYLGWPPACISKDNLEEGSRDLNSGVAISEPNRIRTINKFDISRMKSLEEKFFVLGMDKGYGGNPYLDTDKYDVIFYDENNQLISSLSDQSLYKKVFTPENTHYMDFVFHQPHVPAYGDTDFYNAVIFMTQYRQCDTLMKNCTIDGSGSLGFAICGGDGMIVEDCIIENTQSLKPGYAVDVEDGWEYTNNILFKNNTFRNNANNVVICAGNNICFDGNSFTYGRFYVWSRATNYKVINNRFDDSNCTFQTDYSKNDYVVRGNTFIRGFAKASVFDQNTFISSGLIGGPLVKNSLFYSVDNTQGTISGTYTNCTFSNFVGNGIFDLYDCVVTNSRLQSQYGFRGEHVVRNFIQNTLLSDSTLEVPYDEVLTVSDSIFEESNITLGGGWNTDVYLMLENNEIHYTNPAKPFIYAQNYLGSLSLSGNTISMHASKPLIMLQNINGIDTDLTLANNIFNANDGGTGDIITSSGNDQTVFTLRDVNNTYNNFALSDAEKNKHYVTYSTSPSTVAIDPRLLPLNSIVVDNMDSGFSTDSPWVESTYSLPFYQSNYLIDGSVGADAARWAKWTPTISITGSYDVYMWWTAGANRPDAAPLEIAYNGGIDRRAVNQTINGGKWVWIGRYPMTKGSSGSVKISAADGGQTIADAVKFILRSIP